MKNLETKNQVAVLLVLIAVLAGCSIAGAESNSSNDELIGLNKKVILEVLNNSEVEDRLAGLPEETATAMRQGIALNFSLCRAAFDSYEDWYLTGTPSELAQIEEPAKPIDTAFSQFKRDKQQFISAINSGDISILRDLLTNESGCGVWIPVEPGNENGQTIAEAVSAQ